MTSRRVVSIIAATCAAVTLAIGAEPERSKTKTAAPASAVASRNPIAEKQALDKWSSLPLVFEPNLGQVDPQVRFLTRSGGMTSFITDRENVMVLSRRAGSSEVEQMVVRMKLDGASAPLRFEGLEETGSLSNYFTGGDPSKWVTKVPNYQQVRAYGVYPNVDVVYYGDGRRLEFDFVVGPGGDPSKIKLAYDGADGLTTDAQGNLLIATRFGVLVQHKPLVYQEVNGKRRPVQVAYAIRNGKVAFALGNWDRQKALVIDPALTYSTYLGGSGADTATSIAVQNGLIYVAGRTFSSDFPAGQLPSAGATGVRGNADAFVSKLDPTQSGASSLIYSTYLSGSTNDEAWGVAVDSSGQAYLTGFTESTNFPVVNAYQATSNGGRDAFVSKLSADGTSLLASTYFGGAGDEKGRGIALDGTNNIYITGFTQSANFPTMGSGAQSRIQNTDVFMAEFSTSGRLIYSTCVGADDADYVLGNNAVLRRQGIAVNGGSVYVAGTTDQNISGVGVRPGGAHDAFAVNWSTSTGFVWGAYIGGTNDDYGTAVAADTNGVYVTGYANSTINGQSGRSGFDAYAAQLAPSSGSLIFFRYLGGTDGDYGSSVAVDQAGSIWVTGWTARTGSFPATDGSGTRTGGIDSWDAFVAQVDPTVPAFAPLPYATVLASDSNDFSFGIAAAPGFVYIAGETGVATSLPFPTTSNAYSATGSGGTDAFVTALGLAASRIGANQITATEGSLQQTPIHIAFPLSLTVKVRDSFLRPQNNVAVTFTAPIILASATLVNGGSSGSSVTVRTDSNGVASVSATANGIIGTYPVTATISGDSAEFILTNTIGVPTTLTFTQQPTNTPAGAPISPVKVTLTDAAHNPISGKTITLTAQPGTGSLMGTVTAPTDATGVATFSNLEITTVGTYTLQASLTGVPSATSNAFNITAASARTIAVAGGNNQSAAVGTAYTTPLSAVVKDTYQNVVPSVPVTFTLPNSGASGTFPGSALTATATTNSSGVATSPTITANTTVGSFSATASSSGATGNATFSLTNNIGAANKLSFVQQPSNAAAGAAISPTVTVQVQDQFGNNVPVASIAITLSLNTGALSGPVTRMTNSAGLATFGDLNVQKVGTYTLTATATGGLSSATSTSFTIHAGAPASITASGGGVQTAQILTVFAQHLSVTVLDRFMNPASGATVNYTAPGAGASSTLTAPASTDSNGQTSVTATANATAGSYTVSATVGTLTAAAFSLTNTPGAPGSVTFATQPNSAMAGVTINPVTIQVLDGGHNPVPQGIMVTIALQEPGTLNGTLSGITLANGQVTFSTLSVNQTGTYHLVATTGTVSGVSNPFTISPATNSIVITVLQGDGQSAVIGTTYAGTLQAQLTDVFDNLISGAVVTFSAPASGASISFAGPATVTTGNDGIATSPSVTANGTPGMFQVSATTTGATGPGLFNLTNLPSGTNQLTFKQQPTNTVAGETITPSVTVQLSDSSGNAVHMQGVPITLQANTVVQRAQRFSGNNTQSTDANGLATFSGLSISLAGTYTLQASTAGAASDTSGQFTITVGTPAIIASTGGTLQSAFVQTVFGSPLQVMVTDLAGNPAGGVMVMFTAPLSGASGTFGGETSITATTDSQGHAAAVITANNIAGSYAIVAATAGITGSATFSLTNLPAASTLLTFITQPSNAPAGQAIAPPVTVQLQTSTRSPSNTAGVAIVMTLSSGTGTLLGTVVQLTDAMGTATFPDLRLNAIGAKQLSASTVSTPSVTSNSFQITAGAPVSITAISGTPQATNVSQAFPLQLQAQVLDVAGNPVPGASVTFAAPGSGPGGSFAGPTNIIANNNGVAVAPILTANGTVGTFAATASAAGVATAAFFSLTNLPQNGPLTVSPTQLSFASQFNQTPLGQSVQLTGSGPTVTWTASSSAPWITVSPTSGSTPGSATISVNPAGLPPGNYSGAVGFSSSVGASAAVLVTYTVTGQPTLLISPPLPVFVSPDSTIVPATQTLQATSTSGDISYKVAAQVSTPTNGNWLSVTPSQGQTVGNVQVSVNPTGLSQGIYNGSVVFTPTDPTITPVVVPVILLLGCGQGGCGSAPPTILSVVNGASFHPSGAPGAAMAIFGVNLSDNIYTASTYPLPTQLGPTTVTVNGNLAPLYYVSPTQIDFQMPSHVPASNVQVQVNVSSSPGGVQALFLGQPHTSTLTVVDPGLFVNAGNRAAALNQDLSAHTPATPLPAGALVLLFITGQGPITPPIPDGTAAPASPLSTINGMVTVNIGGQLAQVAYAGVAPGFAGLSQINAVIPPGLIPGDQSVFITINGVSSNAGLITVK